MLDASYFLTNHRPARVIQQGIFKAAEEQRHQILKHRPAPGKQDRLSINHAVRSTQSNNTDLPAAMRSLASLAGKRS
jgi:hypothetical protein